MLSHLKRNYRWELFRPTLLGLLINPFYIVRRGLLKHISELSGQLSGKLIDFGGGDMPYKDLFQVDEYVGVEYAEGGHHVFNIDEVLSEFKRVLKSNGRILTTVPFVWKEHEVPHGFGRYSSFGVKYLLGSKGFEILKCQKNVCGFEAYVQIFIACLYASFPKQRLVSLLLTLLLIAPINILNCFLKFVFPRNKNLYISNIVLAKKI